MKGIIQKTAPSEIGLRTSLGVYTYLVFLVFAIYYGLVKYPLIRGLSDT